MYVQSSAGVTKGVSGLANPNRIYQRLIHHYPKFRNGFFTSGPISVLDSHPNYCGATDTVGVVRRQFKC